MGAAHGAEMGEFGAFLRQGFVMELLCLVGIEAEIELIIPAELKTGFGKRIIANLRAGVALGQVCCVSGNFISDNAIFYIILVRQAKMFLGRNITQHCRAIPADHGGADGGCNMIVARAQCR